MILRIECRVHDMLLLIATFMKCSRLGILWRHGLKVRILIVYNECKMKEKFDKYWGNIER